MIDKLDELTSVYKLLIEDIYPNPYQPRHFFDEGGLEELANSIKTHGVLQPITVRLLPSGKYELVAGERRLRACKLLSQRYIPAIIVEISETEQAILALLENIQRKQLTFFEEAEGFSHLIERHNLTQEQLAKKLGLNQSTIANKLRLLRLDSEVRERIVRSNLTERHARALLKIHDTTRHMQLLDTIIARQMNVQATEDYLTTLLETEQLAKRKSIYKTNHGTPRDYRIFLNTINTALELVKKAGVPTHTQQTEYEGYFEYVIKIEK